MGMIVQPATRRFHNRPMREDVYRVRLLRVLAGYDDLLPPIQPYQEEDDPDTLTLLQCLPWNMEWPKSQIRLGKRGATPQTSPLELPARGTTSKTTPLEAPERSHGKTVVAPSPTPDMEMAQHPADDDLDAMDFIADDFDGGDYIAPPPEEPYHSTEARGEAPPADKSNCKRLFGSQEDTPPDVAPCTETQKSAKGGVIFSPGTIRKAANEEIEKECIPKAPKPRKRGPRSKAAKSASQPAKMPLRVQDGPPTSKHTPKVHVMGQPMLNQNKLKVASGDMRSLHDSILYLESRLIESKDPSYPVFIAMVPKDLGFVESTGADRIVLRFSDIFDMFHSNPLHYSMVRLYSLGLAVQVSRDNTPGIAIADPFYMRHDVLCSVGNQVVASTYLRDFMLANQTKDYILVPYFAG